MLMAQRADSQIPRVLGCLQVHEKNVLNCFRSRVYHGDVSGVSLQRYCTAYLSDMIDRLVSSIGILSVALLSVVCAESVSYTCAIKSAISSIDGAAIRSAINVAQHLSAEVPLSEVGKLRPPSNAQVGEASISLALTSTDRAEMVFEMNGIQQFNASAVIANALNGTNMTLAEVSVQVNATFAIRAIFSVSGTYSLADFRQDMATDLNITLESITVEELDGETEPSKRRLLLSTSSKNFTVTVTATEFPQAHVIQNVMQRPHELLVERSSVQLRADSPSPAIVARVTTIFTSVTSKSVQDLFSEKLSDVTVSQLTQRVNTNFLAQGFWSTSPPPEGLPAPDLLSWTPQLSSGKYVLEDQQVQMCHFIWGTTGGFADPKTALVYSDPIFDIVDTSNRFNVVDPAANMNNTYPLKFVSQTFIGEIIVGVTKATNLNRFGGSRQVDGTGTMDAYALCNAPDSDGNIWYHLQAYTDISNTCEKGDPQRMHSGFINLVHGDIITVAYMPPPSVFLDEENGRDFNISFTVGDLATDISFSGTFPPPPLQMGHLGISVSQEAHWYMEEGSPGSIYWRYAIFGSNVNGDPFEWDTPPVITDSYYYDLVIDADRTDIGFIGSDTIIKVTDESLTVLVYSFDTDTWAPSPPRYTLGDKFGIEVVVRTIPLNGKQIGFNVHGDDGSSGGLNNQFIFTLTITSDYDYDY
jgi:hypothetical protein